MTEEVKAAPEGGVVPPREAMLVKAMKKFQQAKIPPLPLKEKPKKPDVTMSLDESTQSSKLILKPKLPPISTEI